MGFIIIQGFHLGLNVDSGSQSSNFKNVNGNEIEKNTFLMYPSAKIDAILMERKPTMTHK